MFYKCFVLFLSRQVRGHLWLGSRLTVADSAPPVLTDSKRGRDRRLTEWERGERFCARSPLRRLRWTRDWSPAAEDHAIVDCFSDSGRRGGAAGEGNITSADLHERCQPCIETVASSCPSVLVYLFIYLFLLLEDGMKSDSWRGEEEGGALIWTMILSKQSEYDTAVCRIRTIEREDCKYNLIQCLCWHHYTSGWCVI